MKRIIGFMAFTVFALVLTAHAQTSAGSSGTSGATAAGSPGITAGAAASSDPSLGKNVSGNAAVPASAATNAGIGSATAPVSNSGSTSGTGLSSTSSPTEFSGGNVQIHRLGSPDQVPANMNVISQGQVVSIDRGKSKVTIQDSRSGSQVIYSISDNKMFSGLNQGDRVQIFSGPLK